MRTLSAQSPDLNIKSQHRLPWQSDHPPTNNQNQHLEAMNSILLKMKQNRPGDFNFVNRDHTGISSVLTPSYLGGGTKELLFF